MSNALPTTAGVGPDVPCSADVLLPLVYQELRRLAAKKLANEKQRFTLDATGLVHEAYIRLSRSDKQPRWQDKRQFFAAAAESMRRILVDKARSSRRQKRGGERMRVALQNAEPAVAERSLDVLAVDEALSALAAEHPEKAELVKLRYFAGLTISEAAAAQGISPATADRHWGYARAWLGRHIRRGTCND